jgi:NADH:ubiquinone oxidoreductase subunit K
MAPAFNFVMLILAFVCFVLGAFGVAVPRVNLVALGLAAWMLTLLVR